MKQQEWCQQEQSLKSIEQALNQFQVQENKLQRTVSELQALQQTTAQRVSSLYTKLTTCYYHTNTFMHCQALPHTIAQQVRSPLYQAYHVPITLSCTVSKLQILQHTTI